MIPQIRKVLYATDLSKNSAYAFLYTTDIGKMVMLPAMEPLPSIVRFYGNLDEESKYYQHKKKVDTELLKRSVSGLACKVSFTSHVCFSH